MIQWLLVGALPAETLPVLGRLSGAFIHGSRLVSGRLDGLSVAVLTCGAGPEKAARRTAAALAELDAEQVMSFGTCGALSDDLRIGDLLCGSVAHDEQGRTWPLLPLPGLRAAQIATVSSVVGTRVRREALAQRGHEICEMEAAAVARAAGGRPCAACKIVSDRAGADRDAAVQPPRVPSPIRILGFQSRALRLVEGRLLTVLRAALAGSAGSSRP